tara:strand:- start:416 stop:1342 length:927 start_codon:yes stop_codon:yes gene_type:complete
VRKEEWINQCLYRLSFKDLSLDYLKHLAELAKAEDLEGAGLANPPTVYGDLSSNLLQAKGTGRASLVSRESLVVCGLPVVPVILETYHPKLNFEPASQDGMVVQPNESLGTIHGPVKELLTAERVLLNFLQSISGVTSETRRYAEALGDSPTKLLDTRKTTPGYRMLQKYAVATGGGWNHRLGLFDRVILKDNHLAANQSTSGDRLASLVDKAKEKNPDFLVEVEIDSLSQIAGILPSEPDIIMLDNFSTEDLTRAVDFIGDRCCTEASGGITLENIQALRQIGLDFISTSALVHHASWKDIGLDWIS